ncbi:hypothetical protein LJY25_16350 [Hymenobacter sp. BT175]|uniref:hypothetical protein n=1 Tax=Hymenobacter translucens TaxID=2886507 RepID=UPI001D0EEC54|nr:hypothetical protein [Hymenobacter translucens]MCC2548021.1 hypothetical protein [Hymenobacter translucens]
MVYIRPMFWFPRFLRCLLPALPLLAACSRPAYSYQPLSTPATAEAPTVVFLIFRARSTGQGPLQVELLDTKTAAGALKQPLNQPLGPNYLEVSELDASRRVLASARVEHPLLKDVEYQTEAGALARKAVQLPEAEFFVRLRREPGAAFLRVAEVRAQQPATVIDLPFPSKL